MEKERKILINFTSYILLGFLICLIGLSNVFASTYQSTQFTAQLYDNYGTSLQAVTTNFTNNSYSGIIPYMQANTSGGAWGISSPIALLENHNYSLTLEIIGAYGGALILSSVNRIGIGRTLSDAVYSYVNSTVVDTTFSRAVNGYTLQFAFTAKMNASYIVIPFSTNLSGSNYEFRISNIVIDDLGSDSLTQQEITNSLDSQTNELNNSINNMGESIKDSINDNFNTCEVSPNLFNYNSYTFDKVVHNAYYFIDLGTFKPNTLYTIYNYNKNGLNPNYSYTFMSLLPNYGGIVFSNLAEFNSVTVNTDNNGKLYLGVSSTTITTFTENDWNNFIVNFSQAMLVEGQSTGKPYQPYGEEKCQNKIDQTNDKLDQTNDKLNDLNDSLNNSNSSGATNDASNFFSNFTTDTFGLTSIITAPLNIINSITSTSCSSLNLPLPYLDNEYLTLPCMGTIYTDYFGTFFNLYQTITFGIVAYWVIVRIFNQVKDFKNPEHDEIEVLDL